MVDGPLKGKTLVSKRFAQYPVFHACLPSFGGKAIDTPQEITDQLTEILKAPTGAVVRIV